MSVSGSKFRIHFVDSFPVNVDFFSFISSNTVCLNVTAPPAGALLHPPVETTQMLLIHHFLLLLVCRDDTRMCFSGFCRVLNVTPSFSSRSSKRLKEKLFTREKTGFVKEAECWNEALKSGVRRFLSARSNCPSLYFLKCFTFPRLSPTTWVNVINSVFPVRSQCFPS